MPKFMPARGIVAVRILEVFERGHAYEIATRREVRLARPFTEVRARELDEVFGLIVAFILETAVGWFGFDENRALSLA